jgi:IS30 family transposase
MPADRMSIQALLQAELSGPETARKLGFSRSAINREINRGKAVPTALASHYQAAWLRRAACSPLSQTTCRSPEFVGNPHRSTTHEKKSTFQRI